MANIILIFIAVAAVIFVIVVAMQPTDFRVIADSYNIRACGSRFCPSERIAEMGSLVAVGKT